MSINYTPLDFHYDEQIQRYFLQFMRIFSGFQVMTGKDANGNQTIKRVPCRYADASRQASYILKNQSENTLLSAPFITCFITGISMAPDRRQEPKYVSTLNVAEREWDSAKGEYTQDLGLKATVQRFMPVPYDLTCQVNIWTTNIVQKFQLFEQISILFNPALDIQSSVNALDWSALTYVEMTDISWTSRSVPSGSDDAFDVMTLNFKIPIWINPPAKVKKQSLIEQIILNIGDGSVIDDSLGEDYNLTLAEEELYSRVIVTQDDAILMVSGNVLTMSSSKTWEEYLRPYKQNLRPGVSTIRLKVSGNITDYENDVVGTLNWHPSDPYKLVWSINPLTLPANNIPAITAIINPHDTTPQNGLPTHIGARYLITEEIGPSQNWGNITAYTNDIIEFDGTNWIVAFSGHSTSTTVYVLNNHTGQQLCWSGDNWSIYPDAEYGPGYWRIEL